jgi:hypothetical protein
MTSDPVHLYCKANKELAALRAQSSAELREVRDVKKTAQSLLLEMQTEPEVVAKLPDGGCYVVRVKERPARASMGPEVFQAMQDFWTSGEVEELRAELEGDPALDPIDTAVARLVEVVWPPPVTKRHLEVRAAKETSCRVQDLPQAPTSSHDLLSSIVAAKRLVGDRAASIKEDAQRLKQTCSEAEQRLIPELAQLPAGYVRRVNFKDGDAEDSFFLRLKPPRQVAKRKFSDKKVAKTLKALLGERANADQRAEVVRRICSADFGVALCRDVSELLTQPGELPSVRVALDRVKVGAVA